MIVEVQGVLFDMDGVLVSSIGGVERSWRLWAAHFGVHDAESYQVPHGLRAVDIIRQIAPGLDEAEGLQHIEELELNDMGDTRALPGAAALLSQLPAGRWAIVSSATRRLLLARLQAAGVPVPSLLVTGDMVQRGKPDPEPYRHGAALLGADPAACLVVEDAPSGVGAGAAAGCAVLGVLGTHTAAELRGAGATIVVPSLACVAVRTVEDGRVRLEISDEVLDEVTG